MEHILEYVEFLNEREDRPVVRIISIDSYGAITMFIDDYKYVFYVNDFIIKKFKQILKYSSGNAVNYMKKTAGENYRRLN